MRHFSAPIFSEAHNENGGFGGSGISEPTFSKTGGGGTDNYGLGGRISEPIFSKTPNENGGVGIILLDIFP